MVMIPALGNLQKLVLEDIMLKSGLPVTVAQSLTKLTELRLTHFCLPPEVSYMINLQVLHLTAKGALRLEMKDLDTVAALPLLHTLGLQAGSGEAIIGWFRTCIRVLAALSRRFPTLNLLL